MPLTERLHVSLFHRPRHIHQVPSDSQFKLARCDRLQLDVGDRWFNMEVVWTIAAVTPVPAAAVILVVLPEYVRSGVNSRVLACCCCCLRGLPHAHWLQV